jgi:catechol 2,3-dioxygenase-like lactoylglutathione lyase family enzyme
MPSQITKLTPNLIVSNVERSAAFYRDVLGFTVQMTVPDATPYAFAIVTSGPVEVFLNAPEAAYAEYPAFKTMTLGGTLTLFVEVTEIEDEYARLAPLVTVVMPFEKKWYGMTEFAFLDPDGYIITYAQRTQA